MDARRNSILADMAREASIERSDFLVRAGEQLQRFMQAHANRIRTLGGMTLINEDEDFLAVAPDGTFRSRSRVYDEAKGEWVSETEIIETAAELVELYNPADILQAFADAEDSDLGADLGPATIGDAEGTEAGAADPYAGAADTWAAGQPEVKPAHDQPSAAAALYDLALDFQERSQRAESGLIEGFENAASGLLGQVGTIVVVDDDDEHLALGVGGFRARVIPEGEEGWQDLAGATEIVRFYDPTDVFGDLAEALTEAFPNIGDDDHEHEDDHDDDEADGDSGDDAQA